MKKQSIYYTDAKGRNPVWEFLQKLSPDEKEKCYEYIHLLEESGEESRRPVSDYLEQKIYELRPKQNRILYFFMYRDYVVLVHAFRKKSQAVPQREIEIAVKRMNQFVLRYQLGPIRLGD